MKKVRDDLNRQGFAIFNASNSRVAIHGHGYLELAYVQQGAMVHRIDGRESILNAGDYFIVDHGIKHEYERISEERLLVRNFLFYPKFLDRSLIGEKSFDAVMNSFLLRFCYQTLRSSPTGVTFRDDNGKIRELLDQITEEFEAAEYGYMELIRCAFVQVLILTMRRIGRKENKPTQSAVVDKLIKWLEGNYTEKLRLKTIATELGYNASYLSQKFSEEMGVSFMEYLHRLRIQESCRLLEKTDQKISQIASQVGYESVKYFNKIFRQQLAVTPRAFRAAYRK